MKCSRLTTSLLVASLTTLAGLLPDTTAIAQVTAVVTGGVTASYSSSTDKDGYTTYSFVNASASLNVTLPVIPATATTASGSHYWSSPLTWGSTGIVFDRPRCCDRRRSNRWSPFRRHIFFPEHPGHSADFGELWTH